MSKVQVSKTKMKKLIQRKLRKWQKVTAVGTVVIAAVLTISMSVVPHFVAADSFDDQIRALQQENVQKKSALSALKVEASSFQDAINQLQAQIAVVQQQIDENTTKQNDLQAKIEENQKELTRQRTVLGDNIRVMYVENQITTIEILASSKNLSEFVDKEESRAVVMNKIQDTLQRIAALQEELDSQKVEVERLLAEQKTQEEQLSYSRSEQARLLSYNQSQQKDYTKQLAVNSARIADLKEQQAIENARLFGGGGGVLGGGGYPWGYAKCIHTGQIDGKCSNYDWGINGSIWNPSTGGYGYRNCTDWVAWRLDAPAGLGNAKQWDDRAAAMGYTVSSTPKRGSAAVSNSGEYGHVMYVEGVDADGSIVISDYNRGGTGLYNTATLGKVGEGRFRNANSGAVSTLTFVYL